MYQSARVRSPEHSYLHAPTLYLWQTYSAVISITTVRTRMLLSVTLHVYCLSCFYPCYSRAPTFSLGPQSAMQLASALKTLLLEMGLQGALCRLQLRKGLQKHSVQKSIWRDTTRAPTSEGPQQRCHMYCDVEWSLVRCEFRTEGCPIFSVSNSIRVQYFRMLMKQAVHPLQA